MTGNEKEGWRTDLIQSVVMVVCASVGVALPVDVLSAVDGYLMYLRPWELVPVWGWAFLYYLFFGLLAGVLGGLAVKAVALLSGRDAPLLIQASGRWISMAIIAGTLIRAVKLWIGVHDFGLTSWWLGEHQHWVAALVLVACALAAARDSSSQRSVRRLVTAAAAGSLLVALSAPLVSLLKGPNDAAPDMAAYQVPTQAPRPDIILVTADAFAASHASFLGYTRRTTPQLEGLARQSSVFARYYSNGNFTTAAVNSFINGVRPWTHRANQYLARVSTDIGDSGLVGCLKRSGYQTFSVWTNTLAAPFQNRSARWMDASVFGHTQASGEVFSSLMSARFPHFTPVGDLYFFKLSSKIIDHLAVTLGIWSLADQNPLEPPFSEARSLVEARDPQKPMFLWVHVLRPHSPYAAPAPFLGEFNPSPRMRTRFNSTPNSQFSDPKNDDALLSQYAGRYDESVRYLDSSVGGFIDWLKGQRLFDKSLLIVSSDHGESFTHRYAIHGGPMLYDDIIHVPLLIKEPGQTQGRRVDALAEQVDLMPTILDLVGIPTARPLEGRSLRGAMQGQPIDRPVFSMDFEQNSRFEKLTNGSVAMIEGRWKYVRYLGQVHVPLVPVLTDSLYDLESDPGETLSLVDSQGGVAARMRAAIDEQVALHDKPAQ